MEEEDEEAAENRDYEEVLEQKYVPATVFRIGALMQGLKSGARVSRFR